ncbi:MAG: histidinol dehydrogenase [Rikenellaceae bacterium]|nr:histidinol dehydrogenase [Rikenellaceae bacterium]
MEIIVKPGRTEWSGLLKRPQIDNSVIVPRVNEILNAVKTEGDEALRRFAKQFDNCEISDLKVTDEEIAEAEKNITPELADAIKKAAENIRKFHSAQEYKGIEVNIASGIKCIQKSVPIQTVGIYIPGGTAPLFSTVLMLAIPAKIAGCPEVVMCTPTNKEGKIAPAILYAAKLCGVTEIFKTGGAQAIGAMAYGTESIPKTEKIFGPGNQYVTVAKQQVSLINTAIDMPAGPSEVMVLADKTANPSFVAADLLSQAEHGADSQSILVTDSEEFAKAVDIEVTQQLTYLSRKNLAEKSVAHSRLIVLSGRDEIIEMANLYAAEHLIVSMDNPWKIADKITSAGSVFIGNYTPESAGDYASGTNHTLPTNGWATAYSGVNLDSFNKKITYQEITREGLEKLAPVIDTMAVTEVLDAHANAVRIRLK